MNSPYARDIMLKATYLNRDILPQLYLSLHTGDPQDDGSAELIGGEYERQQLVLSRTAPGVAANENVMMFQNLPSSLVTHFGIWASARGDDFLTGGQIAMPQEVPQGGLLRYRENDFVLRIG